MKKHVFPLSITLLTLVAWLIALPHLPATMPIHWGANGEADGFATKINAMILTVGIMVLIYFIIAFVPRIDPRKENYKYFSKTYNILLNAVLLLFFFVNMSTILQGLGYNVPMSYIAPIMAGLVFIIIGNYLQRVRSNYFMGIRTPWTLSNETVWKKTHRLSGKIFFIGGLLILISAFLPDGYKSVIMWGSIVLCVAIPYLYSYLAYKKEMNM
ncbi:MULTISPECIES: SdpI family protein [Priestia]|uniref:SdpI family protein n=1 Tax=Priestia TaxID=2800373 RepID=UPI0013E36CA3|nr:MULTISPECIES: SdpI family protein [Priestia]MBY0091524.1 SdpI family protein [Priestia aryabhattai]MBY0104148.1 SdpI family protein [Priestia aryabhattai]MCM3307004.1 SdpI family protein [Priestia megaterium]MED3865167.1 SdpI family protein [Priestia megaterium]MED4100516.1 SdpI family protein [Priestia megaterium]